MRRCPSPRPGKPRPFVLVPRTLTALGRRRRGSRRCARGSRRRAARSSGASAMTTASTLPTASPAPRASSARRSRETSRCRRPSTPGRVGGKCSPIEPSAGGAEDASAIAWRSASPSEWPSRPGECGIVDAAQPQRAPGAKGCASKPIPTRALIERLPVRSAATQDRLGELEVLGVVILKPSRETGDDARPECREPRRAPPRRSPRGPVSRARARICRAKGLRRRRPREPRAVDGLDDPPLADALDRVDDRGRRDRRARLARAASSTAADLRGSRRAAAPRRGRRRCPAPRAPSASKAPRAPRRPGRARRRRRPRRPLDQALERRRRGPGGAATTDAVEAGRRERLERPGEERPAGEMERAPSARCGARRVPEPAAATISETCRHRRPTRQTARISFSLRLQEIVDFLDLLVRQLLRLLEAAALVVLGDLLVLEHLLDPVVALVAEAPDLDARLLGHVVRLLGEVLAALLGQRRDRDADDLAVGLRVQAQLRLADRALDLAAIFGSQGAATMSVGSGTERFATWLIGTSAPYADTRMPSSIPRFARPVRSVLKRSFKRRDRRRSSASRCPSAPVSCLTLSLPMTSEPMSSPRTTRWMLPLHVEVEDLDRNPVLHAERDGRRVHDLQPGSSACR